MASLRCLLLLLRLAASVGAYSSVLSTTSPTSSFPTNGGGSFRVSEVLGYDNATAYVPGAPFSCTFTAPSTTILPLTISLRAYFNASGFAMTDSRDNEVAASWLVNERQGALNTFLPPSIPQGYYGANQPS